MAFETGELVGKAESVEGAGIEVVGSTTVVIEVEDDEELEEVDEVGGGDCGGGGRSRRRGYPRHTKGYPNWTQV
jgi:hypothetical protein